MFKGCRPGKGFWPRGVLSWGRNVAVGGCVCDTPVHCCSEIPCGFPSSFIVSAMLEVWGFLLSEDRLFGCKVAIGRDRNLPYDNVINASHLEISPVFCRYY